MTETLSSQIVDESKIDEYFPMPSFRHQQREVIQEIVRLINSGYKYIVAECPTGAGKSPIAVTIARLAEEGKAFYITTTKMLQDQIEADFSGVATLKGRNAYPCTAYANFEGKIKQWMPSAQFEEQVNKNTNCDEGYCKSITNRSSCRLCLPSAEDKQTEKIEFPEGMLYSFCPYFDRLFKAINAQTASMNFNNFILHVNYGTKFGARRILIIDEAHNTEAKLLDFLECTISSHHIDTRVPELSSAIEYVKWIQSINAIGILKGKLDEATESMNMRQMSTYEGLIKKYINMILEVKEDPEGWVCEFEEDDRTSITKATLKPIFAHRAAKNFLFNSADIVVFLSATILNAKTFTKSLGIKDGEYAALRVGSNFPIENRPIITDYAGRFVGGKAKMSDWIGKMVNKIEEIANRYEKHRGIIHTHSFEIQKAITERLSTKTRNRLTQQFDYQNKTDMIVAHGKKQSSIIIAPAMHEGVDLKDDLSRFQILCKVPFANFYDNKQLSARMEIDREYYDYITILKIVQSVGRSVRSETDWADTYIIDESFERVYRNNVSSFPTWFKESVITSQKWQKIQRTV